MTTRPPDDLGEPGEGELVEELGFEVRELDPEAFRTVDGAYSDEPADPAMAPVIEAGGGVAEGFEQAEAALVDNASEGDLDGTDRILRDARAVEEEPDTAVYGEADEERSSELRD